MDLHFHDLRHTFVTRKMWGGERPENFYPIPPQLRGFQEEAATSVIFLIAPVAQLNRASGFEPSTT